MIVTATASVAIGAACSGLLGNVAAGAFMLILRPFKVGDFVSIGGVADAVHEMGLSGTTIVTPDNVMTLMPNVSKDVPPEVNLLDRKPEGPQIAVRPHIHTDHYWQSYFDTHDALIKVCQEAGWPAPSALHQIRQV